MLFVRSFRNCHLVTAEYWTGVRRYVHAYIHAYVDCVWNVMAHAQKPDFVFRRNGRINLNRRERQFSRLLAAEVCASAVVMLDTPCSEVVWRVLATQSFPLHFPSRASPCAIAFQLDTPYESLQGVFRKRTLFFSGASSLPYFIWLNFNVNRDYHDSHPVCIVLYLVFPVSGQRRVFADLGSGSVDSTFQELVFYNCQQKQNVARSWLKWTIFGFSSRGRRFETLLERCSSEFTMSSVVCTCSVWRYTRFEFYVQCSVFFPLCSSFPFLPPISYFIVFAF
jgi:hypothetical protein